jgi:glycosyltransferase involved in cell wall biosynthesis
MSCGLDNAPPADEPPGELVRPAKDRVVIYPQVVEAIVPALNEEGAIANVVRGLLAEGVARVIVVDNGSSDDTAREAERAGASVVHESRRGYGRACQAGMAALGNAQIVVFADGDGCDDPRDLASLIAPIIRGDAEMCLGSRMTGQADVGAVPWHSRFGNWLCSGLLRVLFHQKVTDLGPFRAIRRDALDSLGMSHPHLGWTAEMQAKAALLNLRVAEAPVRYRRRASGRSKITGSMMASIRAGAVIIGTICRLRIIGRRSIPGGGRSR